MDRRGLLTFVLVLLAVSGYMIGWYWYDLAQVVIYTAPSLDYTVEDTQSIKQWLFLVQGIAFCIHCFASFRVQGVLWLKLASGVLLFAWMLFAMAHLVIGGGVLF
jgi:hypothetical protein